MSENTNSGIQTTADGTAYIPASQRADGSTRKAIRVRPGFKPQEDVETYKSRNAEAWKNRGSGGVPGAEDSQPSVNVDSKSKNARRREAAKKRQVMESTDASSGHCNEPAAINDNRSGLRTEDAGKIDVEVEQQKRVRNLLKKLAAIKDLKEKRGTGEKLSHDQLMKIGREDELYRDLKKLNYSQTKSED